MNYLSAKTAPVASKPLLIPCILDDTPSHLDVLSTVVSVLGYEPVVTPYPEEAIKLVRTGQCRLVLADEHVPGIGGHDFLDHALKVDPGVDVIVMTGAYTLESALEAIRRGASDFLPKPIERARLKKTLDELSALYGRRRRVRDLDARLLKDLEFHGVVGKTPAMLEVFEAVLKIAGHYTNVLTVGKIGTGKKLIARVIHQLSPVSQQRLAVCNCSASVDTLLESQLFGHVRGAFAGATDMRPGIFEYANGGTVFLDEVGETSLAIQAKLLRLIQNHEIQRIGSSEVKKVDVRLIAATNRDLRAEVLARRFREDLYYRLSSTCFRIPPLKERPEDIPLLVQFFLKKYNEAFNKSISGLTRRAQAILLRHSWPGNVRELENVISTACVTASGDFIDLPDLPAHLECLGPCSAMVDEWLPLSLADVRNVHIHKVLEMCQGNRLRAAQVLGIGRTSLYPYLTKGRQPTPAEPRKVRPGYSLTAACSVVCTTVSAVPIRDSFPS